MSDQPSPEKIRQILVARPNDPRVMFTWAGHRIAEDPLEALAWSRRARAADPRAAPPYFREAHGLWLLGRNRGAERAGTRGLVADPSSWQAWINLGNVKKRLGDIRSAQRACDRARAAGAPRQMADMNSAITRLRLGEFEAGWRLYRARHHALGADPTAIWPDLEEWDGRPLKGRLRIVTEQGIGDSIMFLTLVEGIAKRVGSLSLLVNPRLKTLLQRSFPDHHVEAPTPSGALPDLPPAEAWICIGDVPRAMGLFCGGDVAPRPYLRADRDRARHLRDRLRRRHAGKRLVGITWTSKAEDGWRRTVAPALWHPIASLEDVALVSLQYSAERRDLAAFGDWLDIDHGIDAFRDLDGLAALVAAMDAVVSPTNNTVHFAGALGVPCHVMLPVDPDWRWGEDGHDFRWYDGTRLYRQRRDGDWRPVVDGVAHALRRKDGTGS